MANAVWKCDRCRKGGAIALSITADASDVKRAVVADHKAKSPKCNPRRAGVLSVTCDLPSFQPPRIETHGTVIQ